MAAKDISAPPSKTGLRPLRRLWGFLKPYRLLMLLTGVALVIAGSSFLVVPAIFRYVVDKGLEAHDPVILNKGLLLMLATAVILAAATYARYSMVSWLGERVVA